MAVRRAPATRVAPFHLRFHPLLRRSFRLSFHPSPSSSSSSSSLPLFFSSLCFVIPVLRILCQRNHPASLAPFSRFSRASCLQDRIFLFQPSLPSEIFSHFCRDYVSTRYSTLPVLSLPSIPRNFLCLSLNLPSIARSRSRLSILLEKPAESAPSRVTTSSFDAAKSLFSLCMFDFNGEARCQEPFL